MQWGGGVIGWQQSTTRYASYFASGQSDSNDTVCENQKNYFTTLVYRIDESECPPVLSLSYTDCIPLSLTPPVPFFFTAYMHVAS